MFSDINRTNRVIIRQIEKNSNSNNIKIVYPSGIQPTRKNVIDKKTVEVYSGGVNYFPFYPVNKDISALDDILEAFNDDVYSVSLKLIDKILDLVSSETDDWSAKSFKGFINYMLAGNPSEQGKLIVRRNRDIAKGTGTLLSPNDRMLGDRYNDVVLTMYKVTGNKGWNGRQIWIPNIKLPGGIIYYSGENLLKQNKSVSYPQDLPMNLSVVAESTPIYGAEKIK